ncbi:MAG TPA: hypothetical protein VF458_17490, partial [Ktedonobacteraceae bacterium]
PIKILFLPISGECRRRELSAHLSEQMRYNKKKPPVGTSFSLPGAAPIRAISVTSTIIKAEHRCKVAS